MAWLWVALWAFSVVCAVLLTRYLLARAQRKSERVERSRVVPYEKSSASFLVQPGESTIVSYVAELDRNRREV